MDNNPQLRALDQFLSAVYGQGTQFTALLRGLGFDGVDTFGPQLLQSLADSFLDVVRKRLAGPSGQDDYYQLLSLRYGLDGLAPRSMEEIARERGQEALQLFQASLEHCRTQAVQNDLKKSLRTLAAQGIAAAGLRPERGQVASRLERLSNLRAAADVARLEYESKRSAILAMVQADLDALELEYNPLLEGAEDNIRELEGQIRADVLMHGESVSGGTYRAVYSKGRVSWDTGGMERYARQHPDVLQYRREGQPSVSLRPINEERGKKQEGEE